MEKYLKIKEEYNSLKKVEEFIKKESPYECSLKYDAWDVRKDANGNVEKCLVVRKSSIHGVKMYFSEDNTLKMTHIIPNKIMEAFLGESKKRYQGMLEVVTEKVKSLLLSGSKKKTIDEVAEVFYKIAN